MLRNAYNWDMENKKYNSKQVQTHKTRNGTFRHCSAWGSEVDRNRTFHFEKVRNGVALIVRQAIRNKQLGTIIKIL